jgi:hypothetical protein
LIVVALAPGRTPRTSWGSRFGTRPVYRGRLCTRAACASRPVGTSPTVPGGRAG